VRIPTKSNCRLGSVAAKTKQLQLDLFKLPKQPINKAVELAGRETRGLEQQGNIEVRRRSIDLVTVTVMAMVMVPYPQSKSETKTETGTETETQALSLVLFCWHGT